MPAFSGDFTKNNAQNVFATLFYKREREGKKECEFWAEGTEASFRTGFRLVVQKHNEKQKWQDLRK